MIWVLLFVIIIAASAFLAFRSMRNYQEMPHPERGYSLFLIRNKNEFNLDLLNKLHYLFQSTDSFFSLERLFKGTQSALLIYGPKSTLVTVPQLNLLELEDYLDNELGEEPFSNLQKKINKNQSYTLTVEPKNNPKKHLNVKNGFLKLLELFPDQYFFWQLVCFPVKGEGSRFQVTVRAIVADSDLHRRVELVKKMTAHMTEFTGLSVDNKNQTPSALYDSFRNRTLIPKEVSAFVLDSQEVINLLSLPS